MGVLWVGRPWSKGMSQMLMGVLRVGACGPPGDEPDADGGPKGGEPVIPQSSLLSWLTGRVTAGRDGHKVNADVVRKAA